MQCTARHTRAYWYPDQHRGTRDSAQHVTHTHVMYHVAMPAPSKGSTGHTGLGTQGAQAPDCTPKGCASGRVGVATWHCAALSVGKEGRTLCEAAKGLGGERGSVDAQLRCGQGGTA